MRDHTRSELMTKLRQRGFEQLDIDAICANLAELGYLDDHRVVQVLLSRAIEEQAIGPRKLQEKLLRRGVPTELMREAVNEYVQRIDEGAIVFKLAEQMSQRDKNPDYILRYLARKGFSREAIVRASEKLRLDN